MCFITSETCDDKKADVIFVLDGSSSEGKVNFQKQLQFVANFTEQYGFTFMLLRKELCSQFVETGLKVFA